MKAAVFSTYGASLTLADVPDPVIHTPSDVIVRIGAAGVCGSDSHVRSGALASTLGEVQMPYILGHENVGWVEAVGDGVTGLQQGDPVVLHPLISCGICIGCRSGNDMYCESPQFPGIDGRTPGGFSEYFRTSSRSVIKLSPGTDPVKLAPLADAGLTAYHAVKKHAGVLGPTSVVAVVGVGGVGQLVVQLLRAHGVRTIVACDVQTDRVDEALRVGATHGLTVPNEPDSESALVELLGSRAADIGFDCVGSAASSGLILNSLRRGGTLSVIGGSAESISVPSALMTSQELTVVGNYVGSYSELVELVKIYESGLITCTETRYALADAEAAMSAVSSGVLPGRAVLIP